MYEICGFCSCCIVETSSKILPLCLSGNGKRFLEHMTMLTVTVYEDLLTAYQSHVYVITMMVLNDRVIQWLAPSPHSRGLQVSGTLASLCPISVKAINKKQVI